MKIKSPSPSQSLPTKRIRVNLLFSAPHKNRHRTLCGYVPFYLNKRDHAFSLPHMLILLLDDNSWDCLYIKNNSIIFVETLLCTVFYSCQGFLIYLKSLLMEHFLPFVCHDTRFTFYSRKATNSPLKHMSHLWFSIRSK